MSRKHKTLKAGATIGMNPYGWGNGGKRKRPTGAPTPAGQVNVKLFITRIIRGKSEDCQDGL